MYSRLSKIFAVISILVFGFTAIPVVADTNVRGFIRTDTTWTKAKSPYIMVGGVIVQGNVTLTIEPDVTIKVGSGYALEVQGCLIARGTETEGITFTALDAQEPGNWAHIKFMDSSIDAEFDNGNYLSGSILQYCTVEYAGSSGNGAVWAYYASPFIDRCVIRQNAKSGIYLYYSDSVISGNTISQNSVSGGAHSGGVGIYVCFSTATISDNTISQNSASGGSTASGGGGIYVYSSTATISDNTILQNSASGGSSVSGGGGIHVYSGTVTISGNTISQNIFSNSSHSSGGGGICVYSSTVAISGNMISQNSASSNDSGYGGGIRASGTVAISDNTIIDNSTSNRDGAAIYYSGSGSITYNTIRNNKSEVSGDTNALYIAAYPNINYNSITDNQTEFTIYYASSYGSPNLDATNNWWGTTDEMEIGMTIYDYFADPTKAIVDFYPFLTSSPSGLSAPKGLGGMYDSGIKLSWNPNSEGELAGYKIYYDTDSGVPYGGTGANEGDSPIDVGNVTSYTLTGLNAGTKYYIAITAYDSEGSESLFSDEISVTTPPVILESVTPNYGRASGGTPVTLAGAGFQDGATVTFGETEAAVNSVSDREISVTTPPGAPGTVNVAVTNPDSSSATLQNGFMYTQRAYIASPKENNCLRGTVSVIGTASAENGLKSWTLDVAQGAPVSGGWVEICSGTEAVNETEFCQWETPSNANGEHYTIRLRVTDMDDNTEADQVVVIVDNISPNVSVSLASHGAVGNYTKNYTQITISGNTEPNAILERAKLLQQADVTFEDVTDRVQVNADGTITGTLAGFDLSEVTVLKLRVKVKDCASNEGEGTSNTLEVDNEPPTVKILTPAKNSNYCRGTIPISGIAGDTISGVAKVQVDGGSGWFDAAETIQWNVEFYPPAPDIVYTIKARAVDNAGNVADAPENVSVKYITYKPTADITEPHDVAPDGVSCKVKIKGFVDTCSGTTLTWKLEYAPGENASTPTEMIKEGCVPVIGDVLGVWDASNLAEGKYTLFLTANNGSNEHQVKINVKVSECQCILGDVDGDGFVTAHDASLVLQHVVGKITLTPEQQACADVTCNGTISALDAAEILRYSVGIITEFPCQ